LYAESAPLDSWLKHCSTCWKASGFDFQWGEIFNDLINFDHTVALRSTHSLTERGTRIMPWSIRYPVVWDDNLSLSYADGLEILGSSTSESLQGLSRPVYRML